MSEVPVTVLQEILEWSVGRYPWQRDALRRLVLNGDISADDVVALTETCKSEHGLADQKEVVPLSEEHIPDVGALTAPVSLVSIFHRRGVNALAEDQTLKFDSGLTLVYGDNGAGKTGYIRILKSACRARGQGQPILGNVMSGAAPFAPVVAIKYRLAADSEVQEWSGAADADLISRVSVFDTHCASVYLTEKTDVAFRPFGLDLFDKLVRACKAVRERLESEQRALASTAISDLQAKLPEGTAAARLVGGISSLTRPEAVETLATLSTEDEARSVFLEKSLLDLLANDPAKLAQQLTVSVGRIQALAQHLTRVEAALSEQSIAAVLAARTEGLRKSEEAKRLREATFSPELLDGTGSDRWATLWEAAREFSQEAYPDRQFPVVDSGAKCTLCQQDLDHKAGQRFKQFEAFVASTTERELRQMRATYSQLRKSFVDLKIASDAFDETLKEIRIENADLAERISNALAINERRRLAVVAALAESGIVSDDCPTLAAGSEDAENLVKHTKARIEALRTSAPDETRGQMTIEAAELRARKLLAKDLKIVLNEIERRKKHAAYGQCIEETRTNAITQKSTAVTKAAVSQKLKQSFSDELVNLSFDHVEVELQDLGGADGVFYHKLAFTRAPGVDLPSVVSEGEQRCLSIAAFFAELSTADDLSGIVFDDPVSSLDYKWRHAVAKRLVQESKKRQVIVFTHDVVFLLALRQLAEELDVTHLDQHVRHGSKGAGVCADELPWVAMPVKKKIGYLKAKWQEADALSREGHDDAYEKEAKHLYGLLREAWERALEEVLLYGVVERFRPSIQTQQIASISDIQPEECKAVEIAMTKCSTWLPGHDKAAAARAPVPGPQELEADVKTLEDWVTAIRRRRQ